MATPKYDIAGFIFPAPKPVDGQTVEDAVKLMNADLVKAIADAQAEAHAKWEKDKSDTTKPIKPEPHILTDKDIRKLNRKDTPEEILEKFINDYMVDEKDPKAGDISDKNRAEKVGAVLLKLETTKKGLAPDIIVGGKTLEAKEFSAYLQYKVTNKTATVDQWIEHDEAGKDGKPVHVSIGLTQHGDLKTNGNENLLIETRDGQSRIVGNGITTQPLKGYYGGTKDVSMPEDGDLLDVYVSKEIYSKLSATKPFPDPKDKAQHVYVMQQMKKGPDGQLVEDEPKIGFASSAEEFRRMQASTYNLRNEKELATFKANQGEYLELNLLQYEELKEQISQKKSANLTLTEFKKSEGGRGAVSVKLDAVDAGYNDKPWPAAPVIATPVIPTKASTPERDNAIAFGKVYVDLLAADTTGLRGKDVSGKEVPNFVKATNGVVFGDGFAKPADTAKWIAGNQTLNDAYKNLSETDKVKAVKYADLAIASQVAEAKLGNTDLANKIAGAAVDQKNISPEALKAFNVEAFVDKELAVGVPAPKIDPKKADQTVAAPSKIFTMPEKNTKLDSLFEVATSKDLKELLGQTKAAMKKGVNIEPDDKSVALTLALIIAKKNGIANADLLIPDCRNLQIPDATEVGAAVVAMQFGEGILKNNQIIYNKNDPKNEMGKKNDKGQRVSDTEALVPNIRLNTETGKLESNKGASK